MEFSDQQLSRFQELYLKHFGEQITKDKVAEKGERLVRFVQAVRQAKQEQRQLNF